MKAGKISYAGVGVAVGGALGFLGVITKWFTYSFPANGGTVTVHLSGTADWTGSIALIAGIGAFAFGGAYVLLADGQIRRISGILMAVCSAFLLFMPLFGATRVSDAVGLVAPVFSTKIGSGLVVSFLGGVMAVAGSFLAAKDMRATEPADAEPGVTATA